MTPRIVTGVGALLAVLTVTEAHPAVQGIRTVSVSLREPVLASQEASQWCWAASIANLFAHYGYRVSQRTIVTQAYGAPVNMTGGDYSNLARLLNRSWRDDSNRTFSARLVAAMDIPNRVNDITNDQIRDAIRDNRPLVIGTTHHAMLVTGMKYTESGSSVAVVHSVQVFDPWPGVGFRDAKREEVTPAGRGGSLLFIADARISADGSGPPVPRAVQMGRSCQTQIGRCGPFYNQPALPVGSSCYCGTAAEPVGGTVVQP